MDTTTLYVICLVLMQVLIGLIVLGAFKSLDGKVTVRLRPETYRFLKNLHTSIETQNNRGTAKPYFLVIRTKRWRVAHSEFHTGETRDAWVDYDGDPTTFHSKNEAITWYCEYNRSVSDPGPNADEDDIALYKQAESELKVEAENWFEGLQKYVEEAYYEEDNVFLTDEAFEDHVRENGHNLKRRGEYHTYMKHAFRNKEMAGIFNAIKEIGEY